MQIEVSSKCFRDLDRSSIVGTRLTHCRFYYADERKEDGSPAFMDISGEAHAQHYVELAEAKEQRTWQQTFVAGKGYQRF
jgi:hypothetical protein